jgi:hypothetical protein
MALRWTQTQRASMRVLALSPSSTPLAIESRQTSMDQCGQVLFNRAIILDAPHQDPLSLISEAEKLPKDPKNLSPRKSSKPWPRAVGSGVLASTTTRPPALAEMEAVATLRQRDRLAQLPHHGTTSTSRWTSRVGSPSKARCWCDQMSTCLMVGIITRCVCPCR